MKFLYLELFSFFINRLAFARDCVLVLSRYRVIHVRSKISKYLYVKFHSIRCSSLAVEASDTKSYVRIHNIKYTQYGLCKVNNEQIKKNVWYNIVYQDIPGYLLYFIRPRQEQTKRGNHKICLTTKTLIPLFTCSLQVDICSKHFDRLCCVSLQTFFWINS